MNSVFYNHKENRVHAGRVQKARASGHSALDNFKQILCKVPALFFKIVL